MMQRLMRSTLALAVGASLLACQAAEDTQGSTPAESESAPLDSLGGTEEGVSEKIHSTERRRAFSARSRSQAQISQNQKAPASKDNAPAPPSATAGLYIIRRGSVTLQVKSVRESIVQVATLVADAGGLVADSNFSTAEGAKPSAHLVLRVPAEHFDAMLEKMGSVGTVFERSITSEDVSLSYVDTESRIRNLREGEASLRKILERSGKLSEVLEVERELSRVRGEIEQAQGRLRHLANQIALATIRVTLTEKVQQVNASPWMLIPSSVENAWHQVGRALAGTFAHLAESSIWLVGYVLPLSIPLVFIYTLVGVGLRRWLVEKQNWLPDAWFIRIWLGVGVVALGWLLPGFSGFLMSVAVVALGIAAVGWLGKMARERLGRPRA